MLHPMHEVLDVLSPWLPELLVAPPWRQRIRGLASTCPAAFDTAVLECRLDPEDPRIDFGVSASVSQGGRERLLGALADEAALEPKSAEHRVAVGWAEQAMLRQHVPLIWLEYDLLPTKTEAPIVFFCVEGGISGPPSPPPLEPAQLRSVAAEGLQLVLDRPLEAGILDRLERCAALLPPGGRILHVASLCTRGLRDLRVCLDMPTHSIPSWLHAIEWPGDEAGMSAALAMCDEKSSVGVHVDITESVQPYVAFEYTVSSGRGSASANKPLVERLIRAGAASPDKAEAVCGWPGQSTVELPHAAWLVKVWRALNFKLIPRPGGRLESKAYLYFQPSFTLY